MPQKTVFISLAEAVRRANNRIKEPLKFGTVYKHVVQDGAYRDFLLQNVSLGKKSGVEVDERIVDELVRRASLKQSQSEQYFNAQEAAEHVGLGSKQALIRHLKNGFPHEVEKRGKITTYLVKKEIATADGRVIPLKQAFEEWMKPRAGLSQAGKLAKTSSDVLEKNPGHLTFNAVVKRLKIGSNSLREAVKAGLPHKDVGGLTIFPEAVTTEELGLAGTSEKIPIEDYFELFRQLRERKVRNRNVVQKPVERKPVNAMPVESKPIDYSANYLTKEEFLEATGAGSSGLKQAIARGLPHIKVSARKYRSKSGLLIKEREQLYFPKELGFLSFPSGHTPQKKTYLPHEYYYFFTGFAKNNFQNASKLQARQNANEPRAAVVKKRSNIKQNPTEKLQVSEPVEKPAAKNDSQKIVKPGKDQSDLVEVNPADLERFSKIFSLGGNQGLTEKIDEEIHGPSDDELKAIEREISSGKRVIVPDEHVLPYNLIEKLTGLSPAELSEKIKQNGFVPHTVTIDSDTMWRLLEHHGDIIGKKEAKRQIALLKPGAKYKVFCAINHSNVPYPLLEHVRR